MSVLLATRQPWWQVALLHTVVVVVVVLDAAQVPGHQCKKGRLVTLIKIQSVLALNSKPGPRLSQVYKHEEI